MEGLSDGFRHQTLLGVTGSGKTYTVRQGDRARCSARRWSLAHNKTLAAQLYGEFKEFFPENSVEYFVSYYDYYQPEAYVPSSDTYIEKDASINEHIEQMRLSATKALLERNDSIIVATVSAIYGLGDPESYHEMILHLNRGEIMDQRRLLRRLADMQYTRNELDLQAGTYRVRGDVIDVFPAESAREAIRVELFDETIESLALFDPLTGEIQRKVPRYTVYPGSHYVTPKERLIGAIDDIRDELRERLKVLREQNKLVEAQRLEQRTMFDMEMMKEVGYCSGIENYSRYLSGRAAGRAATVPVRLSAGQRAAGHRRDPPDHSAARRHVQGRPLAQGDAGGVRLPPAERARQPAAQVRGVGAARAADDLRFAPRPDNTKRATRRRPSSNCCARRTWWIRKWKCARWRRRSTTCCRRSASAWPATSAC